MPPTAPGLQRKACDRADFKLSDSEYGGFSGYGSVFGVVDRQGDIVAKGAFAATLEQFKANGFITLSHDWDALPVATVRECYEDEKGLFIDADFHSTPEAQTARTYVRERINRKKSVGLSIGYWTRDSLQTPEGHVLKRLDLAEVSIVTVPANPEAGAARVKSGPATKAAYLGPYAEQEMTWSALGSLVYALQDALWMCLFYDAEETREARLAQADACLTEFHALVMKGLTALYPEAADTDALAAEVKAVWDVDPSNLHAGTEKARQLDTLLADVGELIHRSREIQTLRAREGRSLSAGRREDLTALHADLGTLLEELKPRATPAERLAAELAYLRRKALSRAPG
jgi:HK97 family phage prohead protease